MRFLLTAIYMTLHFCCTGVYAQTATGRFDLLESHEAPKNFVINPGGEQNAMNLTDASGIASQTFSNVIEGKVSLTVDATTSGQKVKFNTKNFSTAGTYLKDKLCRYSLTYSGDASLYKIYTEQGTSTKISNDLQLQNTGSATTPLTAEIIESCGDLSANRRLVIEATSNSAAAIRVDRLFAGLSSQSAIPGPITPWVAYTPTITGFGTPTSVSFLSRRIGDSLEVHFTFASGTSTAVFGELGLGHNGAANNVTVDTAKLSGNSNAVGTYALNVTGAATGFIVTAGATTFVRMGLAAGTTQGFSYYNGNSIAVSGNIVSGNFKVPIVGWTANENVLSLNTPQVPTITRITATGACTFTTPAGATELIVEGVGGGGGGGGSGTSGGSAGGTGGSTVFDTITASGGGGGGAVGGGNGGGGGISGTLPTNSTAILQVAGGGGAGGGNQNCSNCTVNGGAGGNSAFGGGARGAFYNSAGYVGESYTGGGGGGGGSNNVVGAGAGGGGGSGAYFKISIKNPASSYSCSVGVGGTAGSAGSSGLAGATGGQGIIVVTTRYNNGQMLNLVGGITSNSTGQERIERVVFGGAASGGLPTAVCTASPCTIVSQSGSWVTGVTRGSTGTYTIAIAAGIFSAPPTCIAKSGYTGVASYGHGSASAPSATAVQVYNTAAAKTTATDTIMQITCMGPR